MIIGSTLHHGPLTHEERQRRIEESLCLYCGEPDHMIANCERRSEQWWAAQGVKI